MPRFDMTLLALLASASIAAADQLLVSGFSSNRINVYAEGSGEFVRTWHEPLGPQAIVIGPGGDLFVAAENTDRILRFDGFTGTFLDFFVWNDPATEGDDTGGLNGPTAIAFSPDGSLCVASFETDAILQYDGTTGDFLRVLVSSGDHGLDGPDTGTIFGPDGNLYVPSFFNHRVMRFDGSTGAYVDDFIEPLSGNLQRPRTILFREDGTVIVSSEGTHKIPMYDATSGDYIDDFVSSTEGGLFAPSGMAFGPDGDLYVTSTTGDKVLRFDGETGDPLGVFVPLRSGGLDAPTYLAWVPEFHVRIEPPTPGVAGGVNEIVVTGAKPGKLVVFGAGSVRGDVDVPFCPGVRVGVADLKKAGRAVAGESGVARLTRRVPARFAGATVLLQAVDASTCRTSPVMETRFD